MENEALNITFWLNMHQFFNCKNRLILSKLSVKTCFKHDFNATHATYFGESEAYLKFNLNFTYSYIVTYS